MKPPRFEYHAPGTALEAAQLLDGLGEGAMLLSGGQSLIPILNLRLASPTDVIDLGRVEGLDSITPHDTHLEVGAMVTHQQMELSELVAEYAPLAQAAAGFIGYRAIRNRGTLGGSLAHADPAAEWPVVALALDAELVLTSTHGERIISSDDFFESLFVTAKRPNELITSVKFATRFSRCWGFSEFQRRTGDFATVAVAVACVVENNAISEARVAIAGVADRPVRCPEAETLLQGSQRQASSSQLVVAAAEAARDVSNPPSDLHGSSEYRRQLVFAQTQRAVSQAFGMDAAELINA